MRPRLVTGETIHTVEFGLTKQRHYAIAFPDMPEIKLEEDIF